MTSENNFFKNTESGAGASTSQPTSAPRKCPCGRPGCTGGALGTEFLGFLGGGLGLGGPVGEDFMSLLSVLLGGGFGGASVSQLSAEDTALKAAFMDVRECESVLAQNDDVVTKLRAALEKAEATRTSNLAEQARCLSKLNELVTAYNVAHPGANLDTTIEPRLTYEQWLQYLDAQKLEEKIRASRESARDGADQAQDDDGHDVPPAPTPAEPESAPVVPAPAPQGDGEHFEVVQA